MALVNGRLSSSELATIPGTNQSVYAPLVNQVAAMRQAFAHQFGKPLMVTDGYRSYAEQESLFRARYTTSYLAGRPSKLWKGVRWYQRPGTAMAATPGTSNHGLGIALDLGSGVNSRGTAEHNWMVANAPRFGFRWPSEWARSAGEWWHFEDGAVVPASNYVNFPGVSIGVGGTTPPGPLNPITQEDDMPILIFHGTRGFALLDGGHFIGIGDVSTVQSIREAGIKQVGVTDGDWDRMSRANRGGLTLIFSDKYKWGLLNGGGLTPLGDIATVNALKSSGLPEVKVSDGDFLALTQTTVALSADTIAKLPSGGTTTVNSSVTAEDVAEIAGAVATKISGASITGKIVV